MRNPPNDETVASCSPAEAGAQADALAGPRHSPGNRRSSAHEPERTCILTRDAASPDALVRLALGPDGMVMPDVRAKAPGRGAWIGVDRAALEKAQANGKLKGALSRAFKGKAAAAPADLGARIEAALRQTVLDRLGLEARAGTLVTGTDKIETAARRGDVHLLIHAADAGEDGNRKLDQALRVGAEDSAQAGQGVVFPEERAILSLALGRQNVVHAALIDRAAAQRVRLALERWRAFAGETNGLGTAAAGTPHASADDVNEGKYERYD